MRPSRLPAVLLVSALLVTVGCAEHVTSPDEASQPASSVNLRSTLTGGSSYLVVAEDPSLPSGFAQTVESLGGTVDRLIPEIGVAAVTFAGSLPVGIAPKLSARSVLPNVKLQWSTPPARVHKLSLEDIGDPPTSGDDDFFFDLQWGADAVDAPQAWNSGATGAGVRVAVLDSGADGAHPDLIPNLNYALSTSFVPGQTWDGPPGDHGTHVAGIIGAADNAFGAIGIAPDAELVIVKVIDPLTGSGDFDGILAGIVYAALIESDVVNMSLGVTLSHRGEVFNQNGEKVAEVPAWAISELAVAFNRATNFAYQLGTTIVTSAGNAATNGNRDKDRIHLPSDAPNVLSVSATGPVGWAYDPSTDLDRSASYTNYGTSVISFAAPGGDFMYPGSEYCLVAGVAFAPCWVFDLVFSTFPGGWGWAAGTSMASPHVAGVAALIIGEHGGSMKPAHVMRALRQSADDLGKPGKDMWYGYGRVNAYNAVH